MLHDLLNALEETLFMVFSAGLLTFIIGLPLGAMLFAAAPKQFLENTYIHKPLDFLLNTICAMPYIVFMIALTPVTHIVMGSIDSCISAVMPLTFAAIPTFAQRCDKALRNLPTGLVETAKAIGASPLQILYKILIPEALPDIMQGLTATLTHLVGYSTIAGVLGARGLGGVMVERGYQVFDIAYVLITIILLITLINLIQACGSYIVKENIQHHNTKA